jgi:hypothetical protein
MNIGSTAFSALAFLLFASTALAQDDDQPSVVGHRETVIVNPKLPAYILVITGTAPFEITMHITGGPKSFKGQTITANVDNEKLPGFLTTDVNFDGYKDFAVVEDRGETGNVTYEYWTFDPKRGIFDHSGAFDEITRIDEENHLLISHLKLGNIESTTKYYAVKHGAPVLLKSVETTWANEARDILPASYPDVGVVVTHLYKDGNLQRTFYCRLVELP